jgi:hypothetical protein
VHVVINIDLDHIVTNLLVALLIVDFARFGLYYNPSLGLATKARGLQGYEPRGRPMNHITCFGSAKSAKNMRE